MNATRVVLGLVCGLLLAGCASATAFRVDRSDVIGPLPDSGARTRPPPRRRALGRGEPRRALRCGRPRGPGRAADGRRRLGDRQDLAPVERLGRKPRRDLLCPSEAGPPREGPECGRHPFRRVPDLLRGIPHRSQPGFREHLDPAPALVVPVAQLGARGVHPGRDSRGTALWTHSLPGHQRAGEGRRQPGAHHQHHALQQRPPTRDHLAALGGVQLRFLRGPGAIAPATRAHAGGWSDQPRALGSPASHDADRHPRRSLPGSPDRLPSPRRPPFRPSSGLSP